MTKDSLHPFEKLTPDLILQAIESIGIYCDGRVNALNSYENRVFQIGIEDSDQFYIVKFYRPNRWSRQQILEDHLFCEQLVESDIPVIAPITFNDKTLFNFQDFQFCLFPMKGGRAPELSDLNSLKILGRTLARLHNIGANDTFTHRPELNWGNYGEIPINFITEKFIPFEYQSQYRAVTKTIKELIKPKFKNVNSIRTHGDLHIGNILLRDDIPNLVDFDDSIMAPAIQDIWMLLSGDLSEQQTQLNAIIPAYQEFRPFPFQELGLIESLRTLRMIYHCYWLAKRWDDPAFHQSFSWFDTNNFWQSHINDLTIQVDELQKQPFKEFL